MKERCPDAKLAGPARLSGYALEFNIFSSKRKCGCADIVQRQGSEVWGLLFEVTDACIASLDKYEGVDGGHYRRITAQVDSDGGKVSCCTYEVVSKTPGHLPSHDYLGKITTAAKQYSFPKEYAKMLSGVQTCD